MTCNYIAVTARELIQMKGGIRVMDKPYRTRKQIQKSGHSDCVIIPAYWIAEQARRLKLQKLQAVILEISDAKIVITPSKE